MSMSMSIHQPHRLPAMLQQNVDASVHTYLLFPHLHPIHIVPSVEQSPRKHAEEDTQEVDLEWSSVHSYAGPFLIHEVIQAHAILQPPAPPAYHTERLKT